MSHYQEQCQIAPSYGYLVALHIYTLKKNERSSKLENRAQLGVYLETKNEIHRVYLLDSKRVIHSKHVYFDEHSFLAAKAVQQDYENVGIGILKNTPDEKVSFGSQDHLQEEIISTDNKEDHNALSGDYIQRLRRNSADHPRYQRRDRRPPARFPENTLVRSESGDGPTAKEAITETEAAEWTATMSTKVQALNQLNCRKEVHHQKMNRFSIPCSCVNVSVARTVK